MSPRRPTAEERALWREANKHTTRHIMDEESEVDVHAAVSSAAETNPPTDSPSLRSHKKSTLLPSLAVLAPREAWRVFKPYGTIHATLDLHGMTREEAYLCVQTFIRQQQAQGARHILIITGKGRTRDSVLREQLPHWLNEPRLRPLISAMARAGHEKGGDGALHVLMKKHHG